MPLDQDACYRALRARDARFDGRFFTAVRTTGVFCRPICPAPIPKRENCIFVPSAAAAREAGYRPCLRCRPEASPGTPAWLGTSATVSRALRLIEAGALDDASVDELAARLGVGARHLRRLFLEHLGASPNAVALTRRTLFAALLIGETSLSMTEVAFAAGFQSLRRFQQAIRTTYRRTPSELRRASRIKAVDSPSPSHVTLRLPYREPFQWSALHRFFADRATPGVEATTAQSYRRTFALANGPDRAVGVLEVRNDPEHRQLLADVRLSVPAPLIGVSARLRQMFDLGASPDLIGAHLSGDALLRQAVARAPGLRVPGGWDGFELAVRGILGQQVSVAGATTLAGRLAERFGEELPAALRDDALRTLFPAPQTLAGADLTVIGMPGKRAAAVSSLAAAVAEGKLGFDGARDLDETVAALVELPGIGDWTAQYIAMRALREPDAFPAGDLGLVKALATDGTRPTPAAAQARAQAWRPWRAYAAMYLWHHQATDRAAVAHTAE